MTSYTKRSFAFVAALSVASCGTMTERNDIQSAVKTGSNSVESRLNQLRQDDKQRGAVVRELDGVWLGGKTVKVSRDAELPAVFNQSIRFTFPDRPTLTVIGDRISKIVGLSVRVSPDALIPIEVFSQQRMGGMNGLGGAQLSGNNMAAANGVRLPANVSMTGPIGQSAPSMSMLSGGGYQSFAPARTFIIDQASPFGGTLTELLDQISSKYGVGWDFKDGVISISRLVTRTYQIATITDINDISSTIAKTSSSGGSSGGGGSSNGSMSQAGSVASSSDVSAKMSASIDVVKSLQTAIEGTLTPGGIGKYSISPSGVITVTDTREAQEQIEELVAAENKSVSRQVRIRMQIVDLTSTTNNDLGVDWSWLINDATRKWNVNFFAPAGLPGGSNGFGQLGVIRNGDNSTTSAFLQALASVGKVNIRKDQTYSMMNNRPLSVADTENFIYPARSSPATTSTDSATAVPGVEPGQLTTGTFLNMRTSIQPNGSVIVQFSMDASMRGETQKFVSNGVTLQYPQSTANQYQIYTSIVNGETAVLAGIDNTQQQSTDKSFDGTLSPLLGGGIATNSQRRAVLILLTPQIVEGVN
jgi:type IVB pilus formation R64 PilN family outer membrane protein